MFEAITNFGWDMIGFLVGVKVILIGLVIVGALIGAVYEWITNHFEKIPKE